MATQTAEELEQEFLELLKAQTTAAQPFVATEGEVDQTYPDADELMTAISSDAIRSSVAVR